MTCLSEILNIQRSLKTGSENETQQKTELDNIWNTIIFFICYYNCVKTYFHFLL